MRFTQSFYSLTLMLTAWEASAIALESLKGEEPSDDSMRYKFTGVMTMTRCTNDDPECALPEPEDSED